MGSKIIKTFKDMQDDSAGFYFMSDNLFIFQKDKKGKLIWGSFDVSKMEGSHSVEDIL